MIQRGYYIKARKIQQSEIAHAPPHVREIWDLFLMRANHSSNDTGKLQRGQLFITYQEIREALSWKVGYRKMRYSRSQCENAMKWLRKATMITTSKTTRGMIVTVCNYDFYQNPKNYESHTESHIGNYNDAIMTPRDRQELKNDKKKEKRPEFEIL